MREEYKVFAICLVTLTAFSGMGTLASATPTTPFVTTIAGTYNTENQAGYLVKGWQYSVVDVQAEWEVPGVPYGGLFEDRRSCFWVGISDADSVAQIGTESDTGSGSQSYYVWWATGIGVQHKISSVRAWPGDAMWAEIKYIGDGVFYMTIQDWNTGESFSTYQTDNDNARQYAEWIVEAPTWVFLWWRGIFSLAKFGTVTFNYCFATIGNAPGSISSFEWYKITMASGSYIKAVPSDLFNYGTSFTVTWKNY
jgi:hypothetical protein